MFFCVAQVEGDGDEEVLSCVGGRSFRSVRERWWYIALSKCGVRTRLWPGGGLDAIQHTFFSRPFKKTFKMNTFILIHQNGRQALPQRKLLVCESHPPVVSVQLLKWSGRIQCLVKKSSREKKCSQELGHAWRLCESLDVLTSGHWERTSESVPHLIWGHINTEFQLDFYSWPVFFVCFF